MLKSVIKKIREKISRPEQAFFQDDNILIKNIQEKKLTYLSKAKLISIANTCRSIEIEQLPGVFIEAGVALGGSSILISKTKEQTRAFYMYDVFEMIPPPQKKTHRMFTQDIGQ